MSELTEAVRAAGETMRAASAEISALRQIIREALPLAANGLGDYVMGGAPWHAGRDLPATFEQANAILERMRAAAGEKP